MFWPSSKKTLFKRQYPIVSKRTFGALCCLAGMIFFVVFDIVTHFEASGAQIIGFIYIVTQFGASGAQSV